MIFSSHLNDSLYLKLSLVLQTYFGVMKSKFLETLASPTQLLSTDRVADFLMLSTVIITNRGCTSLVIRYSDVRLGSINNSGDDEASAYFFPLN